MNSQTEKYVDDIIHTAKSIGYSVETEKHSHSTHISCNVNESFPPIRLFFDISHLDSLVNTWCYIRTSSWQFDGERTDLHEVISTILPVILRISISRPISCRLLTEQNSFSGIECEIYGRYLLFDQPYGTGFFLNDLGVEHANNILQGVYNFWLFFWSWFDWPLCDCEVHRQNHRKPPYLYNWQDAEPWAKSVTEAIGEHVDAEGIQYNFRYHPTWKYYRSINSKITVLFEPQVTLQIATAIRELNPWRTLEGINGKLFLSQGVDNIISFKNISVARKLLSKLEEHKVNSELPFVFIPLESHLVAVGNSHILFIERECGKRRFDEEKERIRKRHILESRLLFPITSFVWNEAIDGNEFELLIGELLSREAGVKWIRKVSIGNEPDQGRDLIAEWRTPPLPGQTLDSEKNPYIDRRVIVQCKGFKKNVGKSDVIDIRDTLEHHEAQGYFLAVSSYLTSPLTEHLEKLRNGGKYWVDWWTRSEIEERLRMHPDVAARFPNIVKVHE